MAAFIDMYHQWGAESIEMLQKTLPGRGKFFMMVSELGDPGRAFTLYFPMVVALHAGVGVKLMWSLIFCEWSNMILKWVLAGDRPYWWVHEAKVYAHKRPPILEQFPNTCETGSGMPSGHTELNAAMFYVLVVSLNQMVVQMSPTLSEQQRKRIGRLLWLMYGSYMFMVMLSRVYISAHFPHQCIAGGALGLVIAMIVYRTPYLHVMSRRQYIALSLTIVVSILGVYNAYRMMGGDVLWSVEKAVKWCIRRDYIHVDTTPFYSFSRYSGVSLGLGLALSSSMYKKANRSRFTNKMIASLVILNVGVGQVGIAIHKSLSPNMLAWYPAEFALNAVTTFLLVAAVPHLVRVASRLPAGEKYKKK